MTQRKMNKAALARYTELRNLTLYSMLDFQQSDLAKKLLPTEWRGIATAPVPEKTRLTIRIDADVATFFRKLGPRYQVKINRVLRAFMLAKLTEILGEDTELQEIAAADEIDQAAMQMEVQLADMLERARRVRLGM